jgi:hypothetical protein
MTNTLVHVFTNETVYREPAVNVTVLTARERLVAVPFAFRCQGVDTGGITTDMIAQGAVTRDTLNRLYQSGFVDVGNVCPMCLTDPLPILTLTTHK